MLGKEEERGSANGAKGDKGGNGGRENDDDEVIYSGQPAGSSSLTEDLVAAPSALSASDPVCVSTAACLRRCRLERTTPPAWILQVPPPGTTRPANGPTERQVGEVLFASSISGSVEPLAGRLVPLSTLCRTHAGDVVPSSLHLRRQLPSRHSPGRCRKRPAGS